MYLFLKDSWFLLLTMSELFGKISSRAINKRRNEGCGEYGFICSDDRSYHFCTIYETERPSVDSHDEIVTEVNNKRYIKNICPESTVCDESNVFYCSHMKESPVGKEWKIVHVNDQGMKPHDIKFLSKMHVPLKHNNDRRSVHKRYEDVTNLEDVPECTIYGPDVVQKKRDGTSKLKRLNHGLKSLPESLHGVTTYEIFHCKGPGKFPDPNCCFVYYECDYSDDNTLVPIRKVCSKRQVFDNSINKCAPPATINRRNPSKEEEFCCPSEGKFPYPEDCSKYYVCDLNRNGCGFRATLHCCEEGMIFYPSLNKCAAKKTIILGNENDEFKETTKADLQECTTECSTEHACSQENSEKETTFDKDFDKCETCKVSNSEYDTDTEDHYDCYREGNFPDASNCSNYYTCKMSANGCGYIATHHCCGQDKVFDSIRGSCECKPKIRSKTKIIFDKFPCFVQGQFPDTDNKSNYYSCDLRPDGKGYVATRHCCGSDKTFDRVIKKCVCRTTYERKRQALKPSSIRAKLNKNHFDRIVNTNRHYRYNSKLHNNRVRERLSTIFKRPSIRGTFKRFYRGVSGNGNHRFATINNRKNFYVHKTSSFKHKKLNGANN